MFHLHSTAFYLISFIYFYFILFIWHSFYIIFRDRNKSGDYIAHLDHGVVNKMNVF